MKRSAVAVSILGSVLVSAAVSLTACGSSDSPTGSTAGAGGNGSAGTGNGAGSSTAGSAGAGDSNRVVGTFLVKLAPATGSSAANTTLLGKVYDGPTPPTLVWETAETDGDCTLLTPRVPFCSTPCGGSAACIEDDTCLAYPAAHGLGTVTVSGLKTTDAAESFTMSPIANAYQPPGSVEFAFPPFAEGDPVLVATSGGDYAAFELEGKGIAPLALTSTAFELKSGEPLALSWTRGGLADATMHVKLDISHHGGIKGQIECDTADSGALTISASLVTKLMSLGIAGFPTVIVTRHTIGSTVIAPGRVELEIASVVEQALLIEGITSCSEDADCAGDQTCQDDKTCK